MKFVISSPLSFALLLLATVISRKGGEGYGISVTNAHNNGLTRLYSYSSSSSSSPSSAAAPQQQQQQQPDAYELEFLKSPDEVTDQWELDCYSRPVIQPGGKKLWEVLICDSGNTFRFRQELPSSQVNSKTLRQVVEQCVELVPTAKPSVIRFFRGAMFNMMNVALKELPDITAKPSRCTFALAAWLEERHATVYPKMEGYNAQMMNTATGASFLNVQTPVKLPDSLRGERYAFVSLPLAEFLPGGGVNDDTIGVGRLCPLPPALLWQQSLPAGDTFVSGVVLMTPRAKAMATWLAGTELMSLKADLRKRQLIMETDLDTQYLMARLNDEQRAEGAAMEQAKDQLQGLHFVSVQVDEESDPEGFWLLRSLPSNI
ncbi:hypothetical protein FisN_18Lh230 [Fistulifera solaris]|uniref:Uncharacterized protein n=1 Tax=Fistulifera solaris TaxID=1519565 RepID=A0A1Z5JUH3_FISSO|nr:hypothetical protein FisN_18Lh230 [Fistulifera solaris]|eukprot:GAX17579.1 hypothetical protein FisN_18Lh230 [Fistulifera solaris]